MMRRSANALMRNNRGPRRLLCEVVGSRFPPSASSSSSSSSSSRDGDLQISSLSGCHSGRERDHSQRCRESGNVESMVRDVHITLSRLEDVSHFPVREGRITEELRSTGRRDHRGWIESFTRSPIVEYHGAECFSSGWRLRSPDQKSSLVEPWKSGGILRMLSTKSRAEDDSSQKSSEEKESHTQEEVPTRAQTIDDFQHEEIVGPTVERDLSDTANELRASIGELTALMTNLRIGFLLLGSVQLLAAIWSSSFHGVDLILGLSQHLAFVLSFILAYLLRYFGSAVAFFSKIEERGRMRVLTLSLQVMKMLSLLFFRSSFVVKAVAFGSLFALLGDVWHSHLSAL